MKLSWTGGGTLRGSWLNVEGGKQKNMEQTEVPSERALGGVRLHAQVGQSWVRFSFNSSKFTMSIIHLSNEEGSLVV